ncbi:MAG: methyltransferase domain-containing protein [Patescibacteria group bacterium]|nr:methyltransferase domain-containing protein [Patescibacteria group bacterium]
MNIKPLIKPILNNFPFFYDILGFGTKGSNSARYCYSVWLRHLVRAHEAGFDVPKVLAELGPGDSLGVGLSAMLSGTQRYYALDIKAYAATEKNLEIFDELVEYFKNKIDIPHDGEFPNVYPKLHSYNFPGEIITDEILARTLCAERLEAIRGLIKNNGENKGLEFSYQAPWHDKKNIKKNSVDMIAAQAVMEHVDDVPAAYEALFQWLKNGGVFSQDIDFKSHNTTWNWNGYYSVSDQLWRIIRGKREWGINRIAPGEHIKSIEKVGFEIISKEVKRLEGGIGRDKLTERFKNISDEDLAIGQMYLLARKV